MPRFDAPVTSLNGGEIGREVQGRITLEGYGATGKLVENFLPEGPGALTYRPGLKFCVEAPDADDEITLIKDFAYRNATGEKHLIMLSDEELRIVNDGGIVQQENSGATVTNGAFTSGLTGWTDYSVGSSTATAPSSGLYLYCDGPDLCGVRQQITVVNPGIPIPVNIEVTRGPVVLKLGNFTGDEDDLVVTTLRAGSHRLSISSDVPFYIDLSSTVRRYSIVASVSIPTVTGDLVLPTPWPVADLRSLRFEQSLSVMYIAQTGAPKRRLERHGADQWSLTLSQEEDGPFDDHNTDETIVVTPSTRVGNGVLTSSQANFFFASDVGTLFEITQDGQYKQRVVSGGEQWSDPILVTGTNTGRSKTWSADGTFVGTIRIQRSVGNDFTWEDVPAPTGGSDPSSGTVSTTVPGTFAHNDGQDNSTIYYRVGAKAGEWTSGSADVYIFFAAGTQTGICRITDLTSDTVVQMEVLTPFGALTGTWRWTRGGWSDTKGWPAAVGFYDGRLWNGLDAELWGSASNAYESQATGDVASDAIERTIGVGAQAPGIHWLMGLGRMIVGCEASEVVMRSSSLDEAITPSNLTIRELTTFGTKDIQPVKVDMRALYVSHNGHTAMEVFFEPQANDYVARPLTRLHRDIGRPGLLQVAVARFPETRVFFIRDDGECVVKLYDTTENTHGWCRLITDGEFESVAVLPGDLESEVYFIVRREVNSQVVRYLEKLDPLFFDDIEDANRLDSYVRYEGSAVTNVPSGTADHLIGETVRVFGNGADLGTNVVAANGTLTTALSTAKTKIVIGLSYTAKYQSSKLALGAQAGSALGQRGRPSQVAFLTLGSTRSVLFGGNFDSMDALPELNLDEVSYDAGPGIRDETTQFFAIPIGPNNDPRFCLMVTDPLPVSIQGYVLGFHLDERVMT